MIRHSAIYKYIYIFIYVSKENHSSLELSFFHHYALLVQLGRILNYKPTSQLLARAQDILSHRLHFLDQSHLLSYSRESTTLYIHQSSSSFAAAPLARRFADSPRNKGFLPRPSAARGGVPSTLTHTFTRVRASASAEARLHALRPDLTVRHGCHDDQIFFNLRASSLIITVLRSSIYIKELHEASGSEEVQWILGHTRHSKDMYAVECISHPTPASNGSSLQRSASNISSHASQTPVIHRTLSLSIVTGMFCIEQIIINAMQQIKAR